MEEDIYYQKYIKYKNKYLSLKEQVGTGLFPNSYYKSFKSSDIFLFLGYTDVSLNNRLYPTLNEYFNSIEKYYQLKSTDPYYSIKDSYKFSWRLNGYLNDDSFMSNILYKDRSKSLLPYLSDHKPIWDTTLNCISWNVDENDIQYFDTLARILDTNYDRNLFKNAYYGPDARFRNNLLDLKADIIFIHLRFIALTKLDSSKKIIINLQECSGELSKKIYDKFDQTLVSYDFVPQVLLGVVPDNITGSGLKAEAVKRGSETNDDIKNRIKSKLNIMNNYEGNPETISRTGFVTFIVVPRGQVIHSFKLKPCLMKITGFHWGDSLTENKLAMWNRDWGYDLNCRGCLVDIIDGKAIFNLHLEGGIDGRTFTANKQIFKLLKFNNDKTFNSIEDVSWTSEDANIDSAILEKIKNEIIRVNGTANYGANRLTIRADNNLVSGYQLDESTVRDVIVVGSGDLNIIKGKIEANFKACNLNIRAEKSRYTREDSSRDIDFFFESEIQP